jgi:hypothetical protein
VLGNPLGPSHAPLLLDPDTAPQSSHVSVKKQDAESSKNNVTPKESKAQTVQASHLTTTHKVSRPQGYSTCTFLQIVVQTL